MTATATASVQPPPYSRLRIALVRHGESTNNVLEATGVPFYYWKDRSADPDLTDRGFKQAELLAQHLGDERKSQFWGLHPISELWVSPVKRTMQTIRPLSRTKLVRSDGPYFAQQDATLAKDAAGFNKDSRRMSAYAKTTQGERLDVERSVLHPRLQLRAFEQGGLFSVPVFDTDPSSTKANGSSHSSPTRRDNSSRGQEPEGKTNVPKQIEFSFGPYEAVGGLTRSQIVRDFPGYVMPDSVTEKGWYRPLDPERPRETHGESQLRAYGFAKMLKARAKKLHANGVAAHCAGMDHFPAANKKPQSENIVLVAHFDFITQLLSSLMHFESTDPSAKESGALMLPSVKLLCVCSRERVDIYGLLLCFLKVFRATTNAIKHHHKTTSRDPLAIRQLPNSNFPTTSSGQTVGTWFRSFNTGVTVIDIDGRTGQVGIVVANSIDHLRDHPELVSGFSLGHVKQDAYQPDEVAIADTNGGTHFNGNSPSSDKKKRKVAPADHGRDFA
ncbi:unnamed protein product [Amoebophrya sp. A25]|nr:unnamed protein product [Amoebophrya sp. A25]|eukprot:GSA25T00014017001.1